MNEDETTPFDNITNDIKKRNIGYVCESTSSVYEFHNNRR